jgi:hypothetical protein
MQQVLTGLFRSVLGFGLIERVEAGGWVAKPASRMSRAVETFLQRSSLEVRR